MSGVTLIGSSLGAIMRLEGRSLLHEYWVLAETNLRRRKDELDADP